MSCLIKDRPAVNGMAKDISLGGMFIESGEALPFGLELTIVLKLPGLPQEARLPAVVRWAKPDGFGVQFGLLGARETHAITELQRH
ncbi:MAG: PilZ domain-containing protein [Myxococcales bacterium]|nr:PilZ domain-containing protein [Myxococcales bacterium]MCB9582692.1 PilZ domain-containing protein [Polyangiaceae bacterium]